MNSKAHSICKLLLSHLSGQFSRQLNTQKDISNKIKGGVAEKSGYYQRQVKG